MISITFASQMLDLMEREGCVVGGRVDLKELADRLEDETFEISLFNQMIMNDCMFEVRSRNYIIE